MNHLKELFLQRRFSALEKQALPLLKVYPDSDDLRALVGACYVEQKRYPAALECFEICLKNEPDNPEWYNHLGITYQSMRDYQKAIETYKEALKLRPEYPVAFYNLGVSYYMYGQFDESIEAFRRAINLKPGYAIAHCHLGSSLKAQGKLEEALEEYNKAIEIDPKYREAYYRRHTVLLDLEGIDSAIESIKKSVELNPDDGYHKLVCAIHLDYAGREQEWVEQVFAAHGDETFNPAYAWYDSWKYVKEKCPDKKPALFGCENTVFKTAMAAAMDDGLVLEFGVRFGGSIKQIASLTDAPIHGFDSFEGLPEEWAGHARGAYSTHFHIPEVPDHVTLHKGWFEDTLPGFVKEHTQPVRFMNVDCDIYSATVTIFENLASQIVQGTVIVFDEYFSNSTWREDEYKAFQEAVEKNGWKYEYLAFSLYSKQAAVRIL